MNSQHCCCCGFERASSDCLYISMRAITLQIHNTNVISLLQRAPSEMLWNVRYVAFSPQTTWFDCLCWTSILVSLLPFGPNSSAVLFSSVSLTSSAQGMVANWHHTGIQDLWDSLSQTEREPFLNTPPQKTISLFVASVLQQPIISLSAVGPLVTLLQTQLRHEIAHVWNMVAFILASAQLHRWISLKWFSLHLFFIAVNPKLLIFNQL